MSVTAEDLCAFLVDLDAPDRLERPCLLDSDAVGTGVARLSEALGATFGCRCTVERLPEGGEHYGSITVPISAGAPFVLVVGWYGLVVALEPDHRFPDGFAAVPLNDDDDLARAQKTVFAAGFAIASPVSALTPRRPPRPFPRLFSASTGKELVRQVRSLPADGPAAELRSWLCATLDVPADGPADERLTSLDVLTHEQILAEAERIRHCVDVMATPQGSDERRWLVIDDTIVDGWYVWAMGAYRNEFGVQGLREANDAVHERASFVRRTRPYGYATGRGRDTAS